MNDTSAIRGQHARAAMCAQNARRVGRLAVVRVVTGMAVPLDGVGAEVVVGRLDDGQSGDRRQLQKNRTGGGFPDPESVARPQHAGKVSAGGQRPTRLSDE